MNLNTVSDKIVFSILNKVVYGYLEITTFSGQILKFGNPDQKLKVTLKIKNQAKGIFNAGFENISILEIANQISKYIDTEIVVSESNDPRTYRQDSKKFLSGAGPYNSIPELLPANPILARSPGRP